MREKFAYRWALLLAGGLLPLMLYAPVAAAVQAGNADEVPANPETDTAAPLDGNIVVTARWREEGLSRTPVTDTLSMTGGFRYTQEKNKFTEVSGFVPFFPVGIVERRKDSDPSWTVGLEYPATPSLFFYGTYRGSWRGGGFNYNAPPVNATAELGGNTFNPERIEDVEFGMKLNGHIGSVRTRANLALYKSWVDGIQRIAYLTFPDVGPGAATVNADGATFQGVEFDAEFTVAPGVTIGGSFNHTDPKYRGDTRQTLFGTFIDFTTFADVAKYSGSGYIDVAAPLAGNAGDLRARLDVYAQSSLYFSNYGKSGAPGTQLPSYELVNARVGLDNIGGSGVSAAFFAKNIFNKTYFVGGIGLGTAGGYNLAVPGLRHRYQLSLLKPLTVPVAWEAGTSFQNPVVGSGKAKGTRYA